MLTNPVVAMLQTNLSGTTGPEHLPSCSNLKRRAACKNTYKLQVHEGL